MLDFKPVCRPERVDTFKPAFHAFKKLHLFAAIAKVFLFGALSLRAELQNHFVHPREVSVHAVFFRKTVRFAPKFFGRDAQFLYHGIFLHIFWRQRFIEIV